ncbi:Cki family colicin immunity protein [Escherichia coli]|nr:Cki family colicin immunity protein [Escherichia coli]
MTVKYYLHNLLESLIPWLFYLLFNYKTPPSSLFVFITSIHVLLYPYSKSTIRYLLKRTTKTDKEPWYLYNILYISYIAMAIPIGLPSLIYYIFKKS